MKQYKLVNNLVGWLAFVIAAYTYCMTIEPTASFWDCPEFITTGYKLEVGHPPGAPFFMLTANLFSQFTSDPSQVARMVNTMSALMSAACILFLFWSITHLVRKLVVTDENNITRGQMVTIMGSGLVGALAYTFSDTFWFSAVEGEVYAFSSLFTAVVFWLILKWEDVANEPHSDRWLILIAYLTGLSIGVHLLNLLCLPAIVLVYYYKKTPNATAKGSLLALLGSGVLVAAVLYGIVPGIVRLADEGMPVTLSVSLHAPNDEIRRQTMPVANAYPMDELLAACRNYIDKTGRRVIFEYALVGGVNCEEKHAIELASRLRGMQCHVNLIPLNAVEERHLKGVNEQTVQRFLHKLEELHISATRRREMGDDIEGACGQLRRKTLTTLHDPQGEEA